MSTLTRAHVRVQAHTSRSRAKALRAQAAVALSIYVAARDAAVAGGRTIDEARALPDVARLFDRAKHLAFLADQASISDRDRYIYLFVSATEQVLTKLPRPIRGRNVRARLAAANRDYRAVERRLCDVQHDVPARERGLRDLERAGRRAQRAQSSVFGISRMIRPVRSPARRRATRRAHRPAARRSAVASAGDGPPPSEPPAPSRPREHAAAHGGAT